MLHRSTEPAASFLEVSFAGRAPVVDDEGGTSTVVVVTVVGVTTVVMKDVGGIEVTTCVVVLWVDVIVMDSVTTALTLSQERFMNMVFKQYKGRKAYNNLSGSRSESSWGAAFTRGKITLEVSWRTAAREFCCGAMAGATVPSAVLKVQARDAT
ncbi:hypothetical protein Agabi119p4_11595 [Agaricus bisporus var. burnettii]|uniref:Uncharacterized protein n=1 Tax=Agaricus bisporus var. burnettii TaxID=192524 RepID=A0A8H7C0M8_AGABI|nr:hypothetical protein Agabi119p4_11595 [Agaricus bisporus var. burnettii]